MKYHGPKERRDAARSEETSPEELRQLSTCDLIFVREAVASNPNTQSDVLAEMLPAKLETEDQFRIALSLIKNLKLSESISAKIVGLLIKAFHDISPRDYYQTLLIDAIARCSNISVGSLIALADPDKTPKHIRQRIATAETNRALLSELLKDPSPKVVSRAKRALEAQ